MSLTVSFQNRAAYIDELGKADDSACRDLVIGEGGALWKFLVASEPHE